MSGLRRRDALGLIAVVVSVRWIGEAGQAPRRVRAGGRVDLLHPEATAFRLETPGRPTVEVPARAGRLRVRAPRGAQTGFCPLRCTPLLDGRPVAAALEVAVYTPRPLYGA